MIYYVLEHHPTNEHSDALDEFVDFGGLSDEVVVSLLATQTFPKYGYIKSVMATMPEVNWRTRNRTRPWTEYISLEYFFKLPPDGNSGVKLDAPIEEHFRAVPKDVLLSLADAKDNEPPAKGLVGIAKAFRDAITKVLGSE